MFEPPLDFSCEGITDNRIPLVFCLVYYLSNIQHADFSLCISFQYSIAHDSSTLIYDKYFMLSAIYLIT